MKKFMSWLKNTLFKKRYKKNQIKKLRFGDMFWGYLYEYNGYKVKNKHKLRSFIFLKFDGELIHCLFTSTKKAKRYACFNIKRKTIYVDTHQIIKINYMEFMNGSNYSLNMSLIEYLRDILKERYSEYKDIDIYNRLSYRKWDIVVASSGKYVVLQVLDQGFLGCIINKSQKEFNHKLSEQKYVNCTITFIKMANCIKLKGKLNNKEIRLMKGYLEKYKRYSTKINSDNNAKIGSEIIISNEKYTILDIDECFYFIASDNDKKYFKIKEYPFRVVKKTSKANVKTLSEKTMYISKTLFNEYMPVRKYTINHDGTISWI